MQNGAIPHLAPIDGLRAVAVLSVILYHLNARLLPGGFLGVDIFFVISGFVVSGALPPAGISGIRQLLVLFYGRRATRIVPALYTCLLVSSVLAMLFIPYTWQSGITERSGLAAVLGYSNVVLARGEGNYFAPRSEFNIFTHTWSLGVEEQFYAIFPWLFLTWLTGRRALSIWLFLAALLVSLGFAYFASTTSAVDGFYLIFSRFWELALGVLAFQFSTRRAVGRLGPVLSIACACAIVFGLATTAPNETPYPASLLPCGAIAVLLVVIRAETEFAWLRRALTTRPMVYLGRISYSLYLWHWPVFVLFRWTIGLQGLVAGAAATLIAIGAAGASYRFIETPPRLALSGGRIGSRTALVAAGILVAMVYPVQQYIWELRGLVSLSTVVRHRLDWYPDASVRTVSASGCKVRADQDRGLDISALAFVRSACPLPAVAPPALFIVGDSHAFAYSDLLAHYVLTTGAPGMLYAEGGCAMLAPKSDDPAACVAFIGRAIADLKRRMKPGDIVFLPGLRIPRIVDQFTYFGEPRARAIMYGAAQQEWRAMDSAATIPVLSRLVEKGAMVVLEAPTPVFGAPTFRCADWFNRTNPICAAGPTIGRATIEQLRAPVVSEFRAVGAAVPGVIVWDPLPVLCPGEVCSAYDGEKPLFFDADHLSGYGNRTLEPVFEAFLAGVGKRRKEGQGSALDPLGPEAPDPH
jgi:peptidoglycan/LPS O-acetylase OafA/YrhL